MSIPRALPSVPPGTRAPQRALPPIPGQTIEAANLPQSTSAGPQTLAEIVEAVSTPPKKPVPPIPRTWQRNPQPLDTIDPVQINSETASSSKNEPTPSDQDSPTKLAKSEKDSPTKHPLSPRTSARKPQFLHRAKSPLTSPRKEPTTPLREVEPFGDQELDALAAMMDEASTTLSKPERGPEKPHSTATAPRIPSDDKIALPSSELDSLLSAAEGSLAESEKDSPTKQPLSPRTSERKPPQFLKMKSPSKDFGAQTRLRDEAPTTLRTTDEERRPTRPTVQRPTLIKRTATHFDKSRIALPTLRSSNDNPGERRGSADSE